MSKQITFVIATDMTPQYCAECEGPLPTAGTVAPWLYRIVLPEVGHFRIDALCPDCGLKHAPALMAGLAAMWEQHCNYYGDIYCEDTDRAAH